MRSNNIRIAFYVIMALLVPVVAAAAIIEPSAALGPLNVDAKTRSALVIYF